jgi:hypothetical protein
MKLEHFGCKKPQGILQELYAHSFMMNLVAVIGNEAKQIINIKTKKRKLVYKHNWQNAFRDTKEKIIELYHNIYIFNNLVELINQIQQSWLAIKPNRCFQKRGRTCNKSSAFQDYK